MKFLVIPAQPDSVNPAVEAVQFFIKEQSAFTLELKKANQRSLSQNSLFHIWVKDIAQVVLQKPINELASEEIDLVKLSLKQECYLETNWSWLCYYKKNVFRDSKASLALRSTTQLDTGQMFDLMEWVQGFALRKFNLILNVLGEYETLKNEQAGNNG